MPPSARPEPLGPGPAGVTVVMITRNRREEALASLDRLTALAEVAEVIVVDNQSTDGTADAIFARHPGVTVLRQARNLGAVGRTVGVRAARCPVVAFADDDSWWDPGALREAAALFAIHPGLGLLHARLVVEPGGEDDPVCAQLAAGVTEAGTPGPAIIGHLACAVAVRRTAFLAQGGYSPLLGFGGEERLLSLDLATAGWEQWYVDSVVARHQPSRHRDEGSERRARCRRNDTLTAWLRLPPAWVLRAAVGFARDAWREAAVRREVRPLLRRLPRVMAERQPAPPHVVDQLQRATSGPPRARRPG